MTEIELVEKTALSVGMKSLLNHGAASCVYSEGCNGVTQAHLLAFTRAVALHCALALAERKSPTDGEIAMLAEECGIVGIGKGIKAHEQRVSFAKEVLNRWRLP
jgi:hypothetical protein